MNRFIDELYNAIYSPKLTPQELLGNLKMQNYTEVNFQKCENTLIGITKCVLDDGNNAEFKYTFNETNHLIQLESNIGNQSEILYDREVEIKKKEHELKNLLMDRFKNEVG
ncbi:hypothetical protein [Radiobacillus deserti]|uniref:Uncharacterized protein n=1 Tax=Radiobacillus deserti TaxID=2594883 RepID=A0A516KHB5_9BACI|nr:hypothetical protein [Radiobacillus deserti]QDP40798.1 hypothetical protein FN924_11740 [Radiobacillus deserti]